MLVGDERAAKTGGGNDAVGGCSRRDATPFAACPRVRQCALPSRSLRSADAEPHTEPHRTTDGESHGEPYRIADAAAAPRSNAAVQ